MATTESREGSSSSSFSFFASLLASLQTKRNNCALRIERIEIERLQSGRAWMHFIPIARHLQSPLNTKRKKLEKQKTNNFKQVARALVHLHSELLSGRTHALEQLMALPELMPLGNSLRELVDRDGSVVATTTAAKARDGGGGESSSSDDEGDDEMEEGGDAADAAAAAAAAAAAPRFVKAPPQIDEDGFQTVVRGGGGGGRRR